MRILFISNLYPPAGNGGYEQWCQEMAAGLQARGHAVGVLTTPRYPGLEAQAADPEWVWRGLSFEMEFGTLAHALRFFTERVAGERANLDTLRQAAASFAPDLIFVWGMWNLPRALAALAEELLPGRVVYYLADYWPVLPSQHVFYWQAPAKNLATGLPKRLLRPVAEWMMQREERPALKFEQVIFPTHFMQSELARRGMVFGQAKVILGAVDTAPFIAGNRLVKPGNHHTLRLLYAGRLSPEKGIETALQAIEILVRRGLTGLHLKITGSGEQGYTQKLHEIVRAAGLSEWVSFAGPAPKQAMPALYQHADIFLFPSLWEEPFGRVLVEAMAAGCVVIGAPTGGSAEIMAAEENALTFDSGNADQLAAQIERLLKQPALAERLACQAQRTAVEMFDLARMLEEIEAHLDTILAAQARLETA